MNNKNSQFGTFSHPSSKRTSSNWLSHWSLPQVGVRTNFVQEGQLDLQCLAKSLANYVVEDNLGASFNFYLGVCWHGVSCLSITVRWSCNDIHVFCWCHLRRRRALFIKHWIGSRVLFYNVPSKHDSTLILLKFRLSLRFLERTDVHQCSRVDFIFVSLCLQNNIFFALDFIQLPCWNRFELLPFLGHCCLCIRTFHCLRHKHKLVLCLRCGLREF